MSIRDRSRWLPDRTPTWGDVLAGVSAVMLLYATGFAEPFGWQWPWVAAGIVLVAIGTGPLANTAIGRSFGDWFRDIGVGGRIVVLAIALVAVFAVEQMIAVPSQIVVSVANGGLVGIVMLISALILRAGEVAGWR